MVDADIPAFSSADSIDTGTFLITNLNTSLPFIWILEYEYFLGGNSCALLSLAPSSLHAAFKCLHEVKLVY